MIFAPTACGAVKVRPFGSLVPLPLLEAWHSRGKRHLIDQVEMFAVLIARSCWADALDDARVIHFVDHSGLLAACISGASQEETWRKLLCALEKDDECPALQWFSRVPSHWNIADGPSKPLGSSSHCLGSSGLGVGWVSSLSLSRSFRVLWSCSVCHGLCPDVDDAFIAAGANTTFLLHFWILVFPT